MDYIEIIKRINRFEEKYPVHEWKIDDLDLWPYIRVALGFRLVEKAQEQRYGNVKATVDAVAMVNNELSVTSSPIKKIAAIPKRIAGKIKRLQFIKEAESGTSKVVFFPPSSTTMMLQDKCYTIFFGPLADHCIEKKISYSIWEYNNGPDPKYPKYHPSYLDIDRYFLEKSHSVSHQPIDIHVPMYNDFYAELVEEIGTDFLTLQYDGLKDEARNMLRLSGMFQHLLKKKQATHCFITCFYSPKGVALCHACHKLGIQSVDVQHGSQSNWFPYIGWANLRDGYNTLPNKFWNWTNDEVSSINEWANKTTKHQAFLGGNTWLIKWQLHGADLKKLFKKELNAWGVDEETKFVLFTAQPFGSEIIPSEIEQAIKASQGKWRWIVRIHPRMLPKVDMLRDELEQKGLSQLVEFWYASSLPLPLVLSYSFVHITQESSSVIEAELMGIPSVIISNEGAQFYLETIKRQMAQIALGSNDICNAIDAFAKTSKESIKAVDYATIFQHMVAS